MSWLLSPMRLPPVAAAGKDAGAGGHAHAGLNHDFPFGTEQDVDARAEFDEADALTGGDSIAGLLAENDTAGDQAGDLLEDHRGAVALNGDDVLLIGLRALFTAGDVEASLLVADVADGAGDGRAVDVDIEDIQKDADAQERGALRLYGNHFAVGRRNSHGARWDEAIGIAEEIQAEQSQDPRGKREDRACEPCHDYAGAEESGRVEDAVEYDH